MESYNQLNLQRLSDETFVAEISHCNRVDSTNSRAAALLASNEQNVKLPLLVTTDVQTAGRGRGKNTWWSSTGALTFSLAVDLPDVQPETIGSLSLTIGVAVSQTLEKHAPAANVGLKWPNDVFIDAKKVAGILVECPRMQAPRLVIGVGVNVNNSVQHAPSELQLRATSLMDQLQRPLDQTSLLVDCLQQLEQRLGDHVHRPADVLDQWRAYCLLTGREVAVESPGQRIAGRCVGIDGDGALLIQQQGQIQRCVAGAVRLCEAP